MLTEPLQLNNMARDSGKKKLLVPIDNMGRDSGERKLPLHGNNMGRDSGERKLLNKSKVSYLFL